MNKKSCIYIYIYIHTLTNILIIYDYIYIYIHTYIHTYIYIYTHIATIKGTLLLIAQASILPSVTTAAPTQSSGHPASLQI